MLVEIGSEALRRTDLHIVEGQWADRTNGALPYTLGQESAVNDAMDDLDGDGPQGRAILVGASHRSG